MKQRSIAIMVLTSLGLAMVPVARTNAAPDDEKVKCATAYEQAQRTRKEGALSTSRKHLLVCTQEACPAVLRTDCLKWLTEVDAAFPTVVLVAHAADGSDMPDVSVFVDGKTFLSKLDGKAYEIEPGVHVFRFQHISGTALEQQVTIQEGEKRRTITVTFSNNGPPKGAIDGPPAPTNDVSRPIPAAVFVLGGLGLVGLGGFAVFGSSGNTKMRELESCKPKCDPSRVDEAKRTYLIGDVSLVVGLAAIGVAGVLFFTRPEASPTTAARITPMAGPIPNGFAAGLSGVF